MTIESIKLESVVPDIFMREGKQFPSSGIWSKPDVTLRKGETILLRAASGTGKSSLLSFLFGIRNDYSGRILFNDTDARSLPFDSWQSIRRTSLAYLPQEMKLFPELTATENIQLKNSLTSFMTDEQIREMMERLEIADRAASTASKMSLGQQQKIAAIRALCQPCDFMLLDEPVSHLDKQSNRLLGELVSEEAARRGCGIIVTSVGNDLEMQFSRTIAL